MRHFGFAPARLLGPAALLATALAARPAAAAGMQDHQTALAAWSDLKAAISQIVEADASNSTNRNDYHRASQRAINALEGAHGAEYSAAAGTPADAEGAIGHIDALLDRSGEPPWVVPLHGAEANIRVAVSDLQDAGRARELTDYQLAVTRALIHLQVAEGRPDQTGVFGGLEGALANTVLGVPADARQLDACAPPSSAPAYGTHDGYLAWVSLPITAGDYALAEPSGASRLSIGNDAVVLRTAAAPIVAKTCGGNTSANQPPVKAEAPAVPSAHAAAQAPSEPASVAAAVPASAAAASASPSTASAASPAAPTGELPALYTQAQAKQGEQIFAQKCVSCHGANLQGVAAPSVAGTDFLQTAQQNGWTVAIIRYIVFDMMPMNAAKSLSPEQYAQVMAFILASNCYPAGGTPFPSANKPDLAKIKLAPVPGHPHDQNGKGVCSVH
jgi:polar amino acid transport system substrate-binding protein